MGTGYTRNDTDNNIADGNVINAADFDGEFDAIVTAFSTSGHTHDGTSAEGGPVSVVGPAQDITISATIVSPKSNNAIDLGTDALEFKDLYLDGVAYIDGFGRDMLVATDKKVQFRDTAIFINSSTDGQLDIDADTELEITAPTVDINASTAVLVSNDLKLDSDSAVLGFGADNDTTLTHTDGTGLTLNSTNKLTFGDAASFVQQSSNGVLRIDGEATIDLNASTAVTVSNDLKLDSDAAVLGFGADNDVTLTHVADTGLLLNSTMALQFNDASQFINAPSATILDINATDEIELNATLVDVNANLDVSGTVTATGTSVFASLDISGDIDVDGTTNLDVTNIVGDLTVTGDTITFTSANANDPALKLINTTNDTDGAELQIRKDKGAAGADGDIVGLISFIGDDAAQQQMIFAKMEASIATAADGSEGGKLAFGVASHDAEFQNGLVLQDGDAEDEVDVTIGSGTGSITNVVGDLGVGTSTPKRQIHLNGGSESVKLQITNSTTGSSSDGDGFQIGIASDGTANLEQREDADMVFSTDNSERIRINNDGNLLIGAVASQSVLLSSGNALQIQGLGSSTSGISTTRHSADSGGPYFNFGKSRGTADGAVTVVQSGDVLGQIFFSGADGTDIKTPAALIKVEVDGTPGSNDMPGRLVFSTTADGASDVTERLRIKSNGTIMSVDAGTDNTRFGEDAGAALVSGANNNTLIGHDAGLTLNSGDENVFVGSQAGDGTADNDENTGVGYRALTGDIGDQNTALGAHAGDASTGNRNVLLGYNVAAAAGAIDDNVVIGSGAASNATFTGNDNVVIGKDAGFDLTSGHSNVLIGHDVGLELKGGAENTAVGFQALAFEDDHNGNTAIGWSVLKNLNAGQNAFNTAVGYNAGREMTTGYYNVAIGANALDNEQAGRENVAVGYEALSTQQENSNNRNTAVGYQSGKALSTAVQSAFFGAYAGGAGTVTGDNNTALGYISGYVLTSGYANTLAGNNAGAALTTGFTNVAIGSFALDNEQAGRQNTAVGYQALGNQREDATNNNTAIGHQAGLYLSTGANNTFLGLSAGEGVSGTPLTGDRNVAIGVNAGVALQGAANENVIMGCFAGDSITTGASNTIIGDSAGAGITTASGNVALGHNALQTGTGTDNTVLGNNAGLQITGNDNVVVGHDAGADIAGGNKNTVVGDTAGGISTGSNNVLLGDSVNVASGGTSNAIVIGSNITGGGNDFTFGKSGNLVGNDFDTDAAFTHASDERLKKNITNQTLGLDFINDLRTVKYNWKPSNELDASDPQLKHLRREDEDGNIINDMNTDATMHNFVAQEVKAALDKAGVSNFGGWKEDQYGVQQVSREMFVIPLVKALQELSAKNDALEARIATLEAG